MRRFLVEEGIVDHVDEELGGGGVGCRGARHGDGARAIRETIAGFVLDGRAGRASAQARFQTTALHHEVWDHAVEQGAIVEAALHVAQEVGHRTGCPGGVEFDIERAVAGDEADLHGESPGE